MDSAIRRKGLCTSESNLQRIGETIERSVFPMAGEPIACLGTSAGIPGKETKIEHFPKLLALTAARDFQVLYKEEFAEECKAGREISVSRLDSPSVNQRLITDNCSATDRITAKAQLDLAAWQQRIANQRVAKYVRELNPMIQFVETAYTLAPAGNIQTWSTANCNVAMLDLHRVKEFLVQAQRDLLQRAAKNRRTADQLLAQSKACAQRGGDLVELDGNGDTTPNNTQDIAKVGQLMQSAAGLLPTSGGAVSDPAGFRVDDGPTDGILGDDFTVSDPFKFRTAIDPGVDPSLIRNGDRPENIRFADSDINPGFNIEEDSRPSGVAAPTGEPGTDTRIGVLSAGEDFLEATGESSAKNLDAQKATNSKLSKRPLTVANQRANSQGQVDDRAPEELSEIPKIRNLGPIEADTLGSDFTSGGALVSVGEGEIIPAIESEDADLENDPKFLDREFASVDPALSQEALLEEARNLFRRKQSEAMQKDSLFSRVNDRMAVAYLKGDVALIGI